MVQSFLQLFSIYLGHICAVNEVNLFLSDRIFCNETLRSVEILWLPFKMSRKNKKYAW